MKNFKNYLTLSTFLSSTALLSLLLTGACQNKKDPGVNYSQLPLTLKDDASPEARKWLSHYHQNYNKTILTEAITLKMNEEADLLRMLQGDEDSEDSVTLEQNLTTSLTENAETKTFVGRRTTAKHGAKKRVALVSGLNTAFVQKVSDWNLQRMKPAYESVLVQKLLPIGQKLQYSSNTFGPVSLLALKQVSDLGGSVLWQLFNIRPRKFETLEQINLVMIDTPGHIQPGYLVRDSQQGYLLYGIETTALGQAGVYFGPTQQLDPTQVAVVDMQMFMMLYSLKGEITSLSAARDFALAETAKRYKIPAFSGSFADDNENPFYVPGTYSQALKEGDDLIAQDTMQFANNFSKAGDGLSLSLTAHKKTVEQERIAREQKADQDRRTADSGNRSNTKYELGWNPHGYKNWEALVSAVKKALGSNAALGEYTVRRRNMDRSKCVIDGPTNSIERDLNDSWGLMNRDSKWSPEVRAEELGVCRATKEITSSDGKMAAGTRLLEPFYVVADKSDEANLAAQREAVHTAANTVCRALDMKALSTATLTAARGPLLNGWDSLFYSAGNTLEREFVDPLATHNFIEIRCRYIPSADAIREAKEAADRKKVKPAGPAISPAGLRRP